MKKNLLLLLVFFLAGFLTVKAQPSSGGMPMSFKIKEMPVVFDTKYLTKPDLTSIVIEDSLRNKNGMFYRTGVSVPVNCNLENSGTWYDLPNGDRIWRLKLIAPDAKAIGVYYDHFWLPPGARLFLYDENKKQILGAYTENNNPENNIFATELIEGETVTLEYFEPSRTHGRSIISISEISYVYRGVYNHFGDNLKGYGSSEGCEVNINCPEGANWQDEKKGVARVYLKVGAVYGWCTGSLLNNVREDCTPYFLTADHCGQGASTSDLSQWVFYFNYEAPTCSYSGAEPSSNTITGCTFKAEGGNAGNDGSDFYLIQFNTAPTFNPYFNGWDRNTSAATGGVGIHHPAGDIQKISTFTGTLTSTSWGGTVPDTHWQVTWTSTVTNYGVTEGGSSGSPIFNNSGQIVGDLTGGGSDCSSQTSPDAYGKFCYSWDQNGTTAATRLKDWLDPDNTGAMTLNGYYCGSSALTTDFVANVTAIPVGGTVDFTDLTSGTPTTWSWTFTGGTPGTSNIQNPLAIQYNTAGIYTVSLTASDGTNTDTETKTGYIIVGNPPPSADFVGVPTIISVGGSVNFTDLSVGTPTSWNWTFNGGTPGTSATQNPSGIVYNTAGTYTVSLTATNGNGSDTETKTNYITVGGVIPGDYPCDTLHYPLPGTMVLYSVHYVGGAYGYISGNNGYSDKAKADYFIPSSPYVKLTGAYLRFGKATKRSSANPDVIFAMWDNSGPGNSPGATPVATDTIPLGTICSQVNGHQMTYIEFQTPVNVTAPFFLGVYLPDVTGDTLALLTNKNGQTLPGTAWEQWQSGSWYRYSDSNSWNYNLSHAIFPVVCKQDFGISEFNNPEHIIVYPNPTNDAVTVDFGLSLFDQIEVKVFNMVGDLIGTHKYSGIPTNTFKIDLSNKPSGIYFLNILAGNTTVTRKVSLIK
jgi:PKD repeat protein